MFHFFGKKKENKVTIQDKIWISKKHKWEACLNDRLSNNNIIFIAWFDETYEELKAYFSQKNIPDPSLFLSREIARNYILNNQVIFVEHYPLSLKEEMVYEKLGLSDVRVYSSLDEALFIHFGGDKIRSLVTQMGMKDDEAIEHALITASIKNAQEKLGEEILIDKSADSQGDWFLKNLHPK